LTESGKGRKEAINRKDWGQKRRETRKSRIARCRGIIPGVKRTLREG